MGYRIDGHRVSKPWHTVLTHYRRKGGRFRVNSGRRTLAEQWRLYRAYRAGKGNLAAYPSPRAPHIRWGKLHHCIDVNDLDGGASRMVRWLRAHGVPAERNVRGEPWHIDPVDRAALLRFSQEIERKRRRANARRRK